MRLCQQFISLLSPVPYLTVECPLGVTQESHPGSTLKFGRQNARTRTTTILGSWVGINMAQPELILRDLEVGDLDKGGWAGIG